MFLADGKIVDEMLAADGRRACSTSMKSLGRRSPHVEGHPQGHPGAKKVRFLLTGVAVMLGVAFISGTFVLTATI